MTNQDNRGQWVRAVNFKDREQPIGKRKVAFVRWLMKSKRMSLEEAQLACSRYFWHEERGRR
jgi:hypothetical protein